MKQSTGAQFHVVYQETDEGYIATVPTLPGCHTQGKTLFQAENRIKEAIAVYLESLSAHREKISHTDRKVFLSSVIIPA